MQLRDCPTAILEEVVQNGPRLMMKLVRIESCVAPDKKLSSIGNKNQNHISIYECWLTVGMLQRGSHQQRRSVIQRNPFLVARFLSSICPR